MWVHVLVFRQDGCIGVWLGSVSVCVCVCLRVWLRPLIVDACHWKNGFVCQDNGGIVHISVISLDMLKLDFLGSDQSQCRLFWLILSSANHSAGCPVRMELLQSHSCMFFLFFCFPGTLHTPPLHPSSVCVTRQDRRAALHLFLHKKTLTVSMATTLSRRKCTSHQLAANHTEDEAAERILTHTPTHTHTCVQWRHADVDSEVQRLCSLIRLFTRLWNHFTLLFCRSQKLLANHSVSNFSHSLAPLSSENLLSPFFYPFHSFILLIRLSLKHS